MSPSAPTVACVGLATRDTIVRVPHWPDPDARLVVPRLEQGGGGPAATAAVALARLGVPVAFVGAVGDDDLGAAIRDELRDEGVDVTGLATVPGDSPQSVILVNGDGGRTILHAPGAPLPTLDAEVVDLLRGASWVHVDHAGYPLLRDAGLLGEMRLSVDAGNAIDGLDLRHVALYAPTAASLAARYPGEEPLAAARHALRDGAESVVVTLGSEGVLVAEAAGAWRIGPVADVRIASTLGAGDVFHGALLAALVRGDPLPEAAAAANVCAALSCRALDGRSAIPGAAELASVAGVPRAEPIGQEVSS